MWSKSEIKEGLLGRDPASRLLIFIVRRVEETSFWKENEIWSGDNQIVRRVLYVRRSSDKAAGFAQKHTKPSHMPPCITRQTSFFQPVYTHQMALICLCWDVSLEYETSCKNRLLEPAGACCCVRNCINLSKFVELRDRGERSRGGEGEKVIVWKLHGNLWRLT